MAIPPDQRRRVTVDLLAEAFEHHRWDPGQVAAEMRVLWLIEQVRERRLSHEKAAELAGVPVAEFLRRLGEHDVSPFDYDAEELECELET